jgi:hypothetical protein
MQLAFNAMKDAVGFQLLPVFEAFAEEIVKLTPAIEQGLSAVASELAIIIRDQVFPALQDFTAWLASPEGTQAIGDLAQAVVDVVQAFFDFVGFIVANREIIASLALVIGGFTIAVKLATAATAIHTTALALMSGANVTAATTTGTLGTALRLLPWAAVAIGVASFIQSLADYSNQVYGSKVNTEGMTEAQAKQAKQVEGLQRLLGQYNYALEHGNDKAKQLAREGIARVTEQLAAMGIRADVAGQHLNDLNGINLDNLQKEVFSASSHLEDLGRIAAVVAGKTPPVFERLGEDIGTSLIKGMDSKTKNVEAAAKKLAKAAVPSGFEWVTGPNGPYLERSSVVSGREDMAATPQAEASQTLSMQQANLQQQGFSASQIDQIFRKAVGGTAQEIANTFAPGVQLVNERLNRVISGNIQGQQLAELQAQGFKLVGKVGAATEEVASALSELTDTILAGGAGSYLMAKGGFVNGPTRAIVGEAGPEVVMPVDRFERAMGLSSQGGSYNININAGMGSDPVSIGREVVNAIKRYESVSGKVFASA